MAKNTIDKTNLGYLGEEFQKQLVKCFIEDPKFFITIAPIVDQNQFTNDLYKRLVGIMRDRFDITGSGCTYSELDITVRAKINDAITLEKMLTLLNDLQGMTYIGLDLIKGNAERFFKQQNLTKAIRKAEEIIKLGDPEKYDEIEGLFQKALEVNLLKSDGFTGVYDEFEQTFADDYRVCIPTGFQNLDDMLMGGIGKGELGVIIAQSGIGKTSATTGFCAAAATYRCEANNYNGFKVLHIFFEDTEPNIRRKYFGWITGIEACNMSHRDTRPIVMSIVNEPQYKDPISENIRMYHAKDQQFSTSDLQNKIRMLQATGFKPDMVVFDYFECVKLERAETSSDSEWTREGATMRAFERIAHEEDVAIWVPVQGSKDSFDNAYVSMKNAGGSVKKVQIGHIVLSLAATPEQKAQGTMNVILNKFRAGAIVGGGMLSNVGFNNGTCRFDASRMDEVDDALRRDNEKNSNDAVKTVRKNYRQP